MAQGDIYTIDVNLVNSSQTVKIVNDSIVLSAIVSYTMKSINNGKIYGKIDLLNSNDEFMHGFFYNSTGCGWTLTELSNLKKLKLSAGEQLLFIAYAQPPRPNCKPSVTRLNAKITLMEV